MKAKPLWSGRFSKPPAEEVQALSRSIDFDQRMWREDIYATAAHAKSLARAKILSDEELQAIESVLREITEEFQSQVIEFNPSDEDIHSVIERLLIDRLGETGAKIHAGRSRNDLVATDLRLWLKREIVTIARGIHELQESLTRKAHEHAGTLSPGYTHLQRAQPILFAHHLLAHAFALGRDFERMIAALRRTDVSPLGASAFAGTTLPLDPVETAKDLGFSKVFDNAADAVGDRDFAIEFLAVAAITAVHVSRLAEEVVLWMSSEFSFASVDDAYATGSSIMPNKKNPDVAELARAKASRIAADLQHLLGVMKGVPLTYVRDLQEDKEPVFDAADTLLLVLRTMRGMMNAIAFDKEMLASAARTGFMSATDLAEWLVMKGVPFRQAHESVGKLVSKLASEARGFHDVRIEDLKEASPVFEVEALEVLDPAVSVARRSSHGGTSPERIRDQLARIELILDDQRRWIDANAQS